MPTLVYLQTQGIHTLMQNGGGNDKVFFPQTSPNFQDKVKLVSWQVLLYNVIAVSDQTEMY